MNLPSAPSSAFAEAGPYRSYDEMLKRLELDSLRPVDLLESVREELEHRRAGLLRPLVAHLDRDAAKAAQRNALFSLSKKLSSWR